MSSPQSPQRRPRRARIPTQQALDAAERAYAQIATRVDGPNARSTLHPPEELAHDATRMGPRDNAFATPRVLSPALPRITIDGLESAQGTKTTASVSQAGTSDLAVVGLIAEGGMGKVLRVWQHSLQREVALKQLTPEAPLHAAETLVAEAVVTGALEHPGIVPVHALGLAPDGKPVMVMKKVDGVSWLDLVLDPSHPRWSALLPGTTTRLEANIQILLSVCNAIHYAHSRGVVHRDIKPSNVMIGSFGEVYVVDWGVALRVSATRTRQEHVLVGTPAYMAPELVTGDLERVDARTDVYLLGATLHEVLTGTQRHSGDRVVDVLAAAYESKSVEYDESIPLELAALCNEATNASPELRPQSVVEFRDRLVAYTHHRASHVLTDDALKLLDKLLDPTQSQDTTPEKQRAKFHSLASECLIGFRQALRVWPDNPRAKQGLDATLAQLARDALQLRDPLLVHQWLGQMQTRNEQLHANVSALENTLLAERNESERVRREREAEDLRIASVERRNFLLVMVISLGSIAGYRIATGRNAQSGLDHTRLIVFAVAMLVTVLGAAWTGRRTLLRSEINRRLTVLAATASALLVAHRVQSALVGTQSVSEILSTDFLILGGFAGYGAATLLRWLWPLAIAAGTGSIVVRVLPRAGPALFGAAVMMLLAAFVIDRWKTRPTSVKTEKVASS